MSLVDMVTLQQLPNTLPQINLYKASCAQVQYFQPSRRKIEECLSNMKEVYQSNPFSVGLWKDHTQDIVARVTAPHAQCD